MRGWDSLVAPRTKRGDQEVLRGVGTHWSHLEQIKERVTIGGLEIAVKLHVFTSGPLISIKHIGNSCPAFLNIFFNLK